MMEQFQSLWEQIKKSYVGKKETLEALFIALLAGGHILLEGVPGLAKTTLAKAFANSINCQFCRIQFTMDLLPSDITGLSIFNPATHDFQLKPGPIFANIILADELNRAPAKTQSALMEAMQENQVTIDGNTLKLKLPFLVIATQNPTDTQGVYDLPEGELDRFLFRIVLDYPTFDEEVQMLLNNTSDHTTPQPVLKQNEIQDLIKKTDNITIHPSMAKYVASLVRYTRRAHNVTLGASPRASIGILKAAKARALIHQRNYVTPDDIQWILPLALNHRIFFDSQENAYEKAMEIIENALTDVPFA